MTKMIGLPWRAVQCSRAAAGRAASFSGSLRACRPSSGPFSRCRSFVRLLVVFLVFFSCRLFARFHDPHVRHPRDRRPPSVTTRSPGYDALRHLYHLGLATPTSTAFSCATFLSSTTRTMVSPSGLGSSAAAGTMVAPSSVAAMMATCTDWPARRRSSGLSACTHTCTVVVLGSDAGLTTSPCRRPARCRRPASACVVADANVLRLVLRHVDAGDDLRHVHHGDDGGARVGDLAWIARAIGDDAGDRTPDFRIADLRLRRRRSGLWRPRPGPRLT